MKSKEFKKHNRYLVWTDKACTHLQEVICNNITEKAIQFTHSPNTHNQTNIWYSITHIEYHWSILEDITEYIDDHKTQDFNWDGLQPIPIQGVIGGNPNSECFFK